MSRDSSILRERIRGYTNQKNNANEMAEIRIRLKNNNWKKLAVKDED